MKLVFGGAIRRERIYPFRPVRFYGVHVEWKNVEKRNPLPSNETRAFTDLSERMNAFPTHILEHIRSNEPCKFQFVGMFRRERIYPFRPVRFYGVHVEWKNVEKGDLLPSNKPRMFTHLSERINCIV